MAGISPNGYKTLWETEKLLATSNSSFSHSVFKRLVQQSGKTQGLFGKGLRQVETISCNMFTPVLKKKNVYFTLDSELTENQTRLFDNLTCPLLDDKIPG